MKNAYIFGSFLVGIANLSGGFNVVATKYLINSLSISVLLELRYLFGILALLPFVCFSKTKFQFYRTEHKFNHREKIIYLAMALCAGVLFNSIYMLGIKNTTAIATGVIGSTIPLLVVAFSVVFLNQKLKKHHLICALLVTIGITILTVGNARNNSFSTMSMTPQISNLIVFIAMIPEAMFMIFAKMLPHKVFPIVSALYINFINLICCTPFFIFYIVKTNGLSISSFELFLCILIGIFSGAMYYVLYNIGMSKINAQTAGLLTGIIPISTTILAVFILHEKFGVFSFIGIIFVLLSIYIGVKASSNTSLQK